MRQAEELSRDELVELVRRVQEHFYLDVDAQGQSIWNPDKPWQGAEICDELAGAMTEMDLAPELITDSTPAKRPKRS